MRDTDPGVQNAIEFFSTVAVHELSKRCLRKVSVAGIIAIAATAICIALDFFDIYAYDIGIVVVAFCTAESVVLALVVRQSRKRLDAGQFGSRGFESRIVARLIGEAQKEAAVSGPLSAEAIAQRKARMTAFLLGKVPVELPCIECGEKSLVEKGPGVLACEYCGNHQHDTRDQPGLVLETTADGLPDTREQS